MKNQSYDTHSACRLQQCHGSDNRLGRLLIILLCHVRLSLIHISSILDGWMFKVTHYVFWKMLQLSHEILYPRTYLDLAVRQTGRVHLALQVVVQILVRVQNENGTRLVDSAAARGKRLLHPWLLPLPGDWTEFVDKAPTEAELAGVRWFVKPGSSHGAPTWQQETARTMNLEATLRPLGRPKKTGATQKQQECSGQASPIRVASPFSVQPIDPHALGSLLATPDHVWTSVNVPPRGLEPLS